jgi:predicted metal-dependent phosphoesterase TrpH
MPYPIDLHMHSRYSDDGEFSPSQLAEQCRAAGVFVMAITDHNSVRAVDEAQKAAQLLGIRCISGVELDCRFQGVDLHLLGYGIRHHADIFGILEEHILQQEKASSEQKLALTNALGFHLTHEDLAPYGGQDGLYSGELIAEALLHDPRYQEHPLLIPYRPGGARSQNPYVNFYWDYYAQGKPCYIEIDFPSLGDAARVIKETGGVPVLAHPGNNLRGRYDLFDGIIAAGVQGVEAFCSYHDESAARYFLDAGHRHGLLITCGSDFHGKTKPSVHLGEMGCTLLSQEMEEGLHRFGLI